MSKDEKIVPDFNTLSDNFKELRDYVNSLLKHIGRDTEINAKKALFEMGETAKHGFEDTFAKPNNKLVHEFKKHPVISTLVLLSIGFLGLRTFSK